MIKSSKNSHDLVTPNKVEEDFNVEVSLRPDNFSEFIGQSDMIANLKVFIKAAKQRKEALDHVLLFGPPGLGKTTIANIIAKELNVNINFSSGPILKIPGDAVGVLTSIAHGDVFFIDEIHRMPTVVEEFLYPAMEDYTVDWTIDKGPNSRSMQLAINPFTLIGATTRLGNLSSPLRDRFGVVLRLDYYENEDLFKILLRSSKILKIQIDENGAKEIARRSRGTPRIANRILRRARDFAQIESNGVINEKIACESLDRLGIDASGLDDMDRRILEALVKKFNGGPVGVDSLGVAISEDPNTIEDVYEPFLIKEGFIQRTPRGRVALDRTYKYLDIENFNNNQTQIFK